MEAFKLRTYDGVALTGFLILPPLFTTGLAKLTEQNRTAAWISLLFAFFIMLCLFLAVSCLTTRYAGKNLIEITSAVLSKPFGSLYGVLLWAYFCFFTGIQIREVTEVLKLYGLKLTPISVIVGLILLAAVILNLLGGRPVVKSAGFFFLLILTGIVFILLLGLNRYNPDNLAPVLGNGLPDIAKNGLFSASLFDSVIVLLLFAPAFSRPSKLKKSGAISLALAAATYLLLSLCFVMMFSPSVGASMASGFIEMGKSIYYNHFFYRFESVLLLILIFAAVLQAAVGLLVARVSLSAAISQPLSKTRTIVCAIPVLVAVCLPANLSDLTQGYLPLIRQYSVFFMAGAPLLVLLIHLIRRCFGRERT